MRAQSFRAGTALMAAAVLVASAADFVDAQQAGSVAFESVNVLPMDRETVLREQTVVVRDGRIEAVGPAASTAVPDDATRVDGRGKYLLPGLAEMHAHIPGIESADDRQFAEDVLFLYVAAGATTIRGMQGHPAQLELRRRVDGGELIGPRMYLAAPQLSGRSVPQPDTGRARVRSANQAGFDLLKIQEGLSAESYVAIVDEAKQQGIRWAGHVPDAVGLHAALEAGQATIDHLDNYVDALEADDSPLRDAAPEERARQLPFNVDENKIPALAQETKQSGAAVVPTMSVWETLKGGHDTEALLARAELQYLPRTIVENWTESVNRMRANTDPAAAAREIEIRNRMLGALNDAGVPILMGTDAPQVFSVPGFSLYHELPIMVTAGMSPFEVLASGSINVARHFGTEAETGTIAVGKRADLLLLNANPLEDISNVEQRAGVMVNGRWLEEAEIQRRLEEITARAGG